MAGTLFPGVSIPPDERLESPVRGYVLWMQTDGNVVLVNGGLWGDPQPVWATHTNGIAPGELIMQTDGNLVLYDTSGQARWDSKTQGNPGAFLNVQDDGNLVVYRAGSTTETVDNSLWSTRTNTPAAIDINGVNYDQFDGPTGASNIDLWIEEALLVAGLPITDGWVKGFETLCNRESSYDPNAVNTTDGNATGPIVGDGHPQNCSRGVAQCIPATFALYHIAGTRTAIYDPIANIAAASLYVRLHYGVSSDGSDFAAKVQQADPNRPPHGY
jgi:hypothetical protein